MSKATGGDGNSPALSITGEYRCGNCGEPLELGPCDQTIIHIKPCPSCMASFWRCFFCDEVFTDEQAAIDHFGSDEYEGFETPGCIDPLRTDEKARLKELRDAQDYAQKMQAEAEENQEAVDMLASYRNELRRLFGDDVSTPHQAWLKLEHWQNLDEANRERLRLFQDAVQVFIGALGEALGESLPVPLRLAVYPWYTGKYLCRADR